MSNTRQLFSFKVCQVFRFNLNLNPQPQISFYFVCPSVCLPICIHAHFTQAGVRRSWKTTSDSLDLQLQMVGSCHVRAGNQNPGPWASAASTSPGNPSPQSFQGSSPPCHHFFLSPSLHLLLYPPLLSRLSVKENFSSYQHFHGSSFRSGVSCFQDLLVSQVKIKPNMYPESGPGALGVSSESWSVTPQQDPTFFYLFLSTASGYRQPFFLLTGFE